ncbi:hypothetical protein SAMN05421788_105228 [Filimonas lacunae]|uniref:Uncharacterized protein n=1 Tax=Filimonas lacunae TaxID=477680 RepID=A0A173MCN3_9BACT|nr:hypothetical protein [Filimonas lacunae]BAV05315.1 hypothetical protein FLA_1322 [Filimonas lacunae]SIT22027.1 hypothetical protein SAMN05421788_105228 [Filimonas lacunae]
MQQEEADKSKQDTKQLTELEEFLLSAPTFSEKQLAEIEKTRVYINQWQTK